MPLLGDLARCRRSPNLVNIYDLGVMDGATYLVLQHLEGWTIQDEIRDCGTLD